MTPNSSFEMQQTVSDPLLSIFQLPHVISRSLSLLKKVPANTLKALDRRRFWEIKLRQDPSMMTDWLHVLNPLMNQKYIATDQITDDPAATHLKKTMRNYIIEKFLATADVVYITLVVRLHYEKWDKEKFDTIYYPAVSFPLLLI